MTQEAIFYDLRSAFKANLTSLKNSFAFSVGGFVIKLTVMNRIVDNEIPHRPDANPSGLYWKSSRRITMVPGIITLASTPAAVPRFQKNVPKIAGTMIINPADDATDNTAIKSN